MGGKLEDESWEEERKCKSKPASRSQIKVKTSTTVLESPTAKSAFKVGALAWLARSTKVRIRLQDRELSSQSTEKASESKIPVSKAYIELRSMKKRRTPEPKLPDKRICHNDFEDCNGTINYRPHKQQAPNSCSINREMQVKHLEGILH